MADSKSSKKKRKLRDPKGDDDKPSKTHRIDGSAENSKTRNEQQVQQMEPIVEQSGPWRNLQLILFLQNKQIDNKKKVELVYEFVKSRVQNDGSGDDEDCQTVKMPPLIVFLSDWVQSLLISSEKRIKFGDGECGHEVAGTCLDAHCWKVFKFCLEESVKLCVSLNFPRNLLLPIRCVARSVLALLQDESSGPKELLFRGEGYELSNVVLDCMSLVFKSHNGLSNENLDLWISTVSVILELVLKVYDEKLEGGNMGSFVLSFLCLVLGPFSKFLRIHPTRKNGFHDFVDKLLEPVLDLFSVLHQDTNGDNHDCARNSRELAEEVLCQGLFHPVHIDGFLNLRTTEKYAASPDGNSDVLKVVIKSYHRHLFDKLESIMDAKKELALGSIGVLCHSLVGRVKMQKGTSMLSEDMKMKGKIVSSGDLVGGICSHLSTSSGNNSILPEEKNCSASLNAETRKSLFDFFVQIMEPLLLRINGHLSSEVEMGPQLLGIHCLFKSVNSLLASLMHERVYKRSDDVSNGACVNFLRKVWEMILFVAGQMLNFSSSIIDNKMHAAELILLGKQLLLAIEYILQIEFEVMANDLLSLWLVLLSFLAVNQVIVDADESYLTPKILDLGCQLINISSESRQANQTIFPLCKAMRLVLSSDNSQESYIKSMPSTALFYKSFSKSVGILLCSRDFKIAVHSAFKFLGKDQASECIQQLAVDLLESLAWLKDTCKVNDEYNCNVLSLDLQAELFGRGLSQIYSLLLDSVTVPMGSSKLQVSLEKVMAVICPDMTRLVSLQPERVNIFLLSVTKRTSESEIASDKCELLKCGDSTWWIFVFFFRLYVSCRSLYRQAISLMPCDSSKKMSALMGDSFTVYCGNDWVLRTDWVNEGYFSWISRPSASLILILQSVWDCFLQGRFAHRGPLVYVLFNMALQRLVELNRHIKSSEYLLHQYKSLDKVKVADDSDLSMYQKERRNVKRHIAEMKQEAESLTGFMMGHLCVVAENQQVLVSNVSTLKQVSLQTHSVGDGWDLDSCSADEKSMAIAIWWILCQNTDVWCTHAVKKDLKMFLSHLIQSSLACVTDKITEIRKHEIIAAGQLNKISLHHISSELLTDSNFYEHKFVRSHMASSFCKLLEKSILQIFGHSMDGDVNNISSIDWCEIVNKLDKRSVVVLVEHDMHDSHAVENPPSDSSNLLPIETKKEEPLSLNKSEIIVCHSLLNFLYQMPKGCSSVKSFSQYATRILNLERHVVDKLIDCQGSLWSQQHLWLLKLFVSCRKASKHLLEKFCENQAKPIHSSALPVFDSQYPVSWLIKSVSVVAGFRLRFSGDCANQIRDMIFSLMDHTSHVFLTICKYHFSLALEFLQSAKDPGKVNSDFSLYPCNLTESDLVAKSDKDIASLETLLRIALDLKEQFTSLSLHVKDSLHNQRERSAARIVGLNKLSSLVSCFNGMCWGIASAIKSIDAASDVKSKLLAWKDGRIKNLNLCINVFADVVSFFLRIFLLEDNPQSKSLSDCQSLPVGYHNTCLSGVKELSLEGFDDEAGESCGKKQQELVDGLTCTALSDTNSALEDASVCNKRKQPENVKFAGSALAEIDLFEFRNLNKHLLGSLLRGHDPEAAFSVRQILIAVSSILRLKSQISCISFKSNLLPVCTGIAQVLLLEFAEMNVDPQSFSFVWLDGVLKYMEEIGCLFTSTNPSMSRSLYSKLIKLHLDAVGRCISLQGKGAALASHETESSTKTINGPTEFRKLSSLQGPYCLDDFKARLRKSFKHFIKNSFELHLLSALQTIERALVGVAEGRASTYKIDNGNVEGGKVAPIVAAGIDCLDLLLEHVSGRKRFNVVKRHIQSLIAALFNIVLHLQGPSIFFEKPINRSPDSGAVILMCVEVLTRVSGKHALFQMESWHVAQSLRLPGALFQNLHQLRLMGIPVLDELLPFSHNQKQSLEAATNLSSVHYQFSIELYAACCRFLYTVIKHHKSESERCVAILQDSVLVLLHCLEMVGSDPVARNTYFAWDVQEGVKCACFLRRTYEELRHQKEFFGKHCYKFLSHYIWVHSGYGPLKIGFNSNVIEALKPGLYAMIEASSVADLQHLHTVFGEGTCRNTLSALQEDYRDNFQYEGKV